MKDYPKIDLSAEAMRIAVNLEQRHDAFIEALRREEALPSSMFFVKKAGAEYLTIKLRDGRSTTKGARSVATTFMLENFRAEKSAADVAIRETGGALQEIVKQAKVLNIPTVPALAAKILRELDIAGVLGRDVMVVGTNAFYAYEIAAGRLFMSGVQETDDFDLSWCRGSSVAQIKVDERAVGSPVMGVLSGMGGGFRINKSKPYQALSSDGYEVELIVAPSLFKTLSKDEVFSPMAVFPEQEWLLMGRPVRSVAISSDGRTCPIFAPDPRYMALLKLWMAEKPDRDPKKKPKDRDQGGRLLDVVAEKMSTSYPLDVDFVMALPDELLPHFNRWASEAEFIPGNNTGWDMR